MGTGGQESVVVVEVTVTVTVTMRVTERMRVTVMERVFVSEIAMEHTTSVVESLLYSLPVTDSHSTPSYSVHLPLHPWIHSHLYEVSVNPSY